MEPLPLALNQATAPTTPTVEFLAACAAGGIDRVALWRHQYVAGDVRLTRRALDDHGVSAIGLCRGGFFTGTRPDTEADADNDAAVREAAALGAPVLTLVCGPVTSAGPADAEVRIRRGIERLLPLADEHDVMLAVEPFHPMLAAERSAIVTLGQATRLVRSIDHPRLGIAIDTYHVWWDPELDESLAAAAPYVVALHVADWLAPTTDLLAGRGLPGDGVIDLAGLLSRVHALGYDGPVEVEVLNRAVWDRPVRELVEDVRDRMARLTAPGAAA
jgi:sugar phosphate isomerase/epimerase